MRKEIRLKNLMYSGFDIKYYVDNPNKYDVYIEEYHYFNGDVEDEGWYSIPLKSINYKKYQYYFVDELMLYEEAGFRLRISMPPRRIEKFRVFLLKLFKR